MTEQLTNIIWMTEQLDFNDLDAMVSQQINNTIDTLLSNAANPTLRHSLYPAER